MLAAAAFVSGCASADSPAPAAVDSGSDTASVAIVVLVDSGQSPAVAGVDGWNYHRSASADIDGDGALERVVIAARVEMVRGRPAWDDGQQWQVYVEEADSSRTVVYARRLQLGALTLRIEASSGSGPRHIVLMEHLPDRLAVYEVGYRGPGDIGSTVRYERNLDPTGELASPSLP